MIYDTRCIAVEERGIQDVNLPAWKLMALVSNLEDVSCASEKIAVWFLSHYVQDTPYGKASNRYAIDSKSECHL